MPLYDKHAVCRMRFIRSGFFCTLATAAFAVLLYVITTGFYVSDFTPRSLNVNLEKLLYTSENLTHAINTSVYETYDALRMRETVETMTTDIIKTETASELKTDITDMVTESISRATTGPISSKHGTLQTVRPTDLQPETSASEKQDFETASSMSDVTRQKATGSPDSTGQPETRRRKAVIILTNARSGSTFLGQIFNQNSNIYYLFEPLLPFTTHCGVLENEKMELLQRMLQCDFSTMVNTLRLAFNVTNYPDTHGMCKKNSMCFFERNTNVLHHYARECYLDSTPSNAQRKTVLSHRTFTFYARSKICGMPLKLPLLEKICKNSEFTVFKILRVCSLQFLVPIFDSLTQNGFDLKVVHLVRDPRAVMASRISARFDGKRTIQNIKPETEFLCGRYRKNVRFDNDRSEDPTWKQQYLRVRYEDLNQNTMQTVEKIYRFVDAKLPDQVRKWVLESHSSRKQVLQEFKTQGNLMKEGKGESSKLYKLRETISEFRNPYATKRDPNETETKWRRNIPFSILLDIQRRCGDIMNRLGYNLFHRMEDVRNLTLGSYVLDKT